MPYDPKYCAILIRHVAEGGTISEFVRAIGISQGTFFNWIKTHADFREARLETKRQGDRHAKFRGVGDAQSARSDPVVASMFWSKCDTSGGPLACWRWTGQRAKATGYGRTSVHGRHWRAHRLAMVLSGVDLPAGSFACHTCDNPGCVNPRHLYVGTPKQNTGDAIARNRLARMHGEKNHQAKLSDADVKQIRRDLADGAKQSEVARRHGVSASTICDLVKGRTHRFDA